MFTIVREYRSLPRKANLQGALRLCHVISKVRLSPIALRFNDQKQFLSLRNDGYLSYLCFKLFREKPSYLSKDTALFKWIPKHEKMFTDLKKRLLR